MIVKNGRVQSRLLYCQVCKVWTNHVATTGGFVCSCGEVVLSITRAERNDAILLALQNEADAEMEME